MTSITDAMCQTERHTAMCFVNAAMDELVDTVGCGDNLVVVLSDCLLRVAAKSPDPEALIKRLTEQLEGPEIEEEDELELPI